MDIDHKFHTHCIDGDFKSIVVDDKFHLYDNQNELNILLPFAPYYDKVEYGHIQYIIRVSLNSWMSFFVTINISSSSSSLKDVASSISLLLKTFKNTPFFKISSLWGALQFSPFLSLEVRRLKLSINCSVSYSIAFECLHPDKVILLSSLSIACLFTPLFWSLFGGVKNSLVLVSFDIFLDFVFSLCSLLIISNAHSESILWNKLYRL